MMIEKLFDKLFTNAYAQFGTVVSTASQTGDKTQSGVLTFFDTIRSKFPGWIAGGVVVLLSFMIASVAKRMVINKVASHLEEDNQAILILVGRTTYVGVLSVGLAIGLSFWGIKIDALLAAFGIGLAFALRDIMTNFIAGVLLLISRQFRIGDFIQVGGSIKGKVQEIQARATILKGLDGTKIIVPNKDIFNKSVISFTTNPFRRIEVKMGVDYRTDISLASDIIEDVLKGHKGTLKEPKPQVLTTSFGESAVDLSVRFWVDSDSSWTKTRSQIIEGIQKAFKEAKITIPWPIRTIVYDKDNMAGSGNEIELKAKDEEVTENAPAASLEEETIKPETTEEPEAQAPEGMQPAMVAATVRNPVVTAEVIGNEAGYNPAPTNAPTNPTSAPIEETPSAPADTTVEPAKKADQAPAEEEIPTKPKADDTGAAFLQNE